MSKINFKQTESGKIPAGWDVKEIGEHFEVNTGKGIHSSERISNGGYPIMGANGVIGHTNNFLVDGDYILTGRVGTLGKVIFKSGKFWISDNSIFIGNRKQTDLKFLYYYLKTFDFQALNVGSTQPLVKQTDIKKIKFPFPPEDEQRTIAKILSDLDEKIEFNHQMNKTLEAIGQAIFKRWFIDFEFPNENGELYKSSGGEMVDSELGDIPKEWEIKSIDKIADFLNGLALQKYPAKGEDFLPVIKIREMKQGITDSTDKASRDIPSEYIIQDGDLLFSWSGSLKIMLWMFGEGALNQHLFKVTSEKYPKWFYYYWLKYHLPHYRHIAKGKATTMGHIQRRHLKESLVLVPPESVLKNMNKVLSPIIDLIINNGIEIQQLSQIRDSLLPRFMSGRIRVGNFGEVCQ